MQERTLPVNHWSDCLSYMSRRVKEQSFRTWLKPTDGEPGSNGDYFVHVPNQFVADWIKGHFHDLIEEAVHEVLGKRYSINYRIKQTPDSDDQTALELFQQTNQGPAAAVPVPVRPAAHNLSAKYHFDSLVVGDFNRFAHAAAMAVAEAPGMTKYNPLFIYGGTGLGKTHIAQAIGHKILADFSAKRVMYATSEKFTSDFIQSISNNSMHHFTKVYRDVDVLIIDDIQFFTGKESTQEQFFHTFNTLYHLGKQIVLTSDRPPRDIKDVEERLLSRFQWGLVADLQAPDLENRTAILLKKLHSEAISMPDNVVRFIADQVSTNIRELEGALIRLLAYASVKKEAIDVELARKVLCDTFTQGHQDVTIERIQRKVAEHFRVEINQLLSKKKTYRVSLPRQVAMYLSRSLTDNSLKSIGEAFGGRDHTTVIHACDQISKKMAGDLSLREKIDRVSADLLY